jgi:Na+/H+ antiporter NhaD/arsenite permease-like protein
MPTDAGSASPELTLTIGLVTLVAVAFGRLPGMSLSRAVLALVGAVALVLTGAVTLERALAHVNGEVLVLLFGLMAVNAALAEAGAFRLVAGLVTRGALGPRRLLALLVACAGALSALFLNDTVAIMLTPLVVRTARRLGLPPVPYLLALALAVNAGSVATVTGNPQNVLVAVAADIGYGRFAARLAPVALASLAVVFLVVLALHLRELAPAGRPEDRPTEELPAVRTGALLLAGGAAAGLLTAFALGANVALAALAAGAAALLAGGRRSGALLRKVDYGLLVLFAALFVVVGAMADTGLPQRWLLAWLPTGGGPLEVVGVTASVTAALSTVVSNVPAVLMLLPATGFGGAVGAAVFDAAPSGAALSAAAAAGTAVPGPAWAGTEPLALTLALASTLAGNLTLVASVANLIVAEGGRRVGVELGFWTYLRAGVPVTLLSLALGVAWLAYGGG